MTGVCCFCSAEFDTAVTYEGVQRRSGPRRTCCSRKCQNQREHRQGRYARKSQLRRDYGITIEQYEAMFADQGGMCAICKREESTRRASEKHPWGLSVDHDHATGRIRGLLCVGCNRGIGFLQDNADLLDRAAAYLRGASR